MSKSRFCKKEKSRRLLFRTFSFSQSGRGPTRRRAAGRPAWCRRHPSRGRACRPQAQSPRCTSSRCPAPRTTSRRPPLLHRRPPRAKTSGPPAARRPSRSLVGQDWKGRCLIGCRPRQRTQWSSGSGRSEGSE